MARELKNFRIVISDNPDSPLVPDVAVKTYTVEEPGAGSQTTLVVSTEKVISSPNFGKTAEQFYLDELNASKADEGITP